MGGENRQALIFLDLPQRFALIVNQGHQGFGDRLRLDAVGAVKAPAGGVARLVPQVAARAGDAGGAFSAGALQRHPARFAPYARQRRPDEGVVTAAFDGKVLFTKACFGELDAAVEHLIVDVVRLSKVTQL